MNRIAVFLLLSMGCSDPNKTQPCPMGICTGGDGGTGGDAGCTEAWSCGAWTKGSDGTSYTRTCNDTNQCGTTNNKPATGPVTLPNLDMDYYKCNVEPIVDKNCAMMGCHGTEVGRSYMVYARGRLRHKETVPAMCLQQGPQDLQMMGNGSIMCEGWLPHTTFEWQSNFDNARATMVGITDPEQSDLLTETKFGGKAHASVHFWNTNNPDYVTIKSWLGGAKLGTTCDPDPN